MIETIRVGGAYDAPKIRRRTLSGSGALRPPPPVAAQSIPRSGTRTSLRAPSRGDPPLKDLRAFGSADGYWGMRYGSDVRHPRSSDRASQHPPRTSDRTTKIARSATSSGGWGREGVRSEARVPLRGIDCAATGPRGAAGPHNPDFDAAELLMVS